MKKEVILVGPDLSRLIDISLQFDAKSYAIFVAESKRPLDYLSRSGANKPDGAIVELTGRENVADIRALLSAFRDTSFVVLVPEFPPHAAIARVVTEYGGGLLRAEENPLVIVATLLALTFQKQGTSA